jgi:hypothetical protein
VVLTGTTRVDGSADMPDHQLTIRDR